VASPTASPTAWGCSLTRKEHRICIRPAVGAVQGPQRHAELDRLARPERDVAEPVHAELDEVPAHAPPPCMAGQVSLAVAPSACDEWLAIRGGRFWT
jgi:hypothetical protein